MCCRRRHEERIRLHACPEAAAVFDPKTKASGKPDKTHPSAKVAEASAKLVADEIRTQVSELAKLLKP